MKHLASFLETFFPSFIIVDIYISSDFFISSPFSVAFRFSIIAFA